MITASRKGPEFQVQLRTGRARSLLSAATAVLVLLGGCATEPEGPVTPVESRPSIPHPPLDEMEPAVAAALEAQRSKLDALLRRVDVGNVQLAQATGRLGQLYQAHRLTEAAEACYREAHSLDPELFDWAYYLGVLAARRGNLEEAVAAFRDALELRPGDLPAMIRLADLELERGKIDPAFTLYTRVRSLDPSMAAAEFGLGRVAAERRSYEQAIEHFDRALTLQPRASVIHYHLGQAYRQLRRLDQATSHLSQSGPVNVAISDPLMSEVNALATGTSPYLIQGNTALRDGRLTVAASAFLLASEADPENVQARQSLATVLTLLGDSRGAVEQLEVAARLAPHNAQAQSDLGSALAEQGRDEQALEYLGRAVELDPGLQSAQFNFANTLARQGRLKEAESHYRRVLEIDPNHLLARARLGTVLAQAGRVEEAIPELRRVVQHEPEDAQARLNLGIALAETNDLKGAIAQHEKVLDLATDDGTLARAHFNLATFFLRGSDRPMALEHFRRALVYDDRLAPAHLNVANLLAGDGHFAESIPHFARVAELQPEHTTARLGHATALMYLGRFPEAKQALENAAALLPNESSVAHALARLLAAAPDPSLRDGERALSLMSRVLASATVPSFVETQAMALAELGRFEDAAVRQRAVLAEVRRRGRTADAERLARNLARYESGLTCCANPTDVFPSS